MAKDLRVPVLALAQLSRANEQREDKRPTKSDLRQAGDIEQDAECIAFIHRPEMYLPKAEPEKKPRETHDQYQAALREYDEQKVKLKGVAELIFDKVRDGPECLVKLHFDGPTTSFRDLEHERYAADLI